MAKKIIILDDLEDQKLFFSRLLSEANYEVILTATESEVLDIVNLKTPSLIMINADLKDQDSYLICKKIKLLEKGEKIPVIFYKKENSYFDGEMMFNAGGSDYISYPFGTSEILHKVSQQIQITELKTQLQEKTQQLNKLIPHYQKLKEALEKALNEINKLKTGSKSKLLSNQAEFEKILKQEWLRYARQRSDLADLSGTSISIVICQINDFSIYQKNHEAEMVNNCLNMIIENLQKTAKRPADVVAQFKKDKFVILLPSTDNNGAKRVAEIISENLAELQIPHHFSEISEFISMSFGVATAIPSQALPATDLIEVAERALQTAVQLKQENAIVVDTF